LCIERDWPEYADIIGLTANKTWQEGLDMHIFVVDAKHPITQGVSDFVIHDEAYNDYRITPGSHILLRTDHPKNNPAEIAWTRQYANSPAVYLMLGHDGEAYRNPNYRTLMHNAICWAAAENKKTKDAKPSQSKP
jgi:type 1 glutamine amidotransferase